MAVISLLMMFVYLILLVGIPVMIGIYVYRDASQRGMNAVLWTLLAVLAPTFIGLIIYLLIRGNYSDLKCPSCETPVTEQYTACPNCGTKLKGSCPNCGFAAEADWKICPKCTVPLPDQMEEFTSPIRRKDTALWKILVIAVLVPLLLFVSIGLIGFASFSSMGSMAMTQMSVEEIKESTDPEINAWISTCDKDPSKIYALHYQTDLGNRKQTDYLIYLPAVNDRMDFSTDLDSGLFGTDIKVQIYTQIGSPVHDSQLISISNHSDKFAGLKILLDGKKIDCEISEAKNKPMLLEKLYVNDEGHLNDSGDYDVLLDDLDDDDDETEIYF